MGYGGCMVDIWLLYGYYMVIIWLMMVNELVMVNYGNIYIYIY